MSSDDEKSRLWIEIVATVLGTLVAAFILWLVPAVRDWIIGVYKNIVSILVLARNYLLSSVEIPWLLIWLLVLFTTPTLWKIISLIVNKIRKIPSEQIEPKLKEYVEDKFYGLIWRWNYIANGFPDPSLRCYCPNCNTRLIARYSNSPREEERTSFVCETCVEEKAHMENDLDYALGLISRQVERRINIG